MKGYLPASDCTSGDNRHLIEDALPPFYGYCVYCEQRFALISEKVLEDAGIMVVGRPMVEQ